MAKKNVVESGTFSQWHNIFLSVSPLNRVLMFFSRCLFWLKVDRTHSNPRTRGRNVGTLRKRAFGAKKGESLINS